MPVDTIHPRTQGEPETAGEHRQLRPDSQDWTVSTETYLLGSMMKQHCLSAGAQHTHTHTHTRVYDSRTPSRLPLSIKVIGVIHN